MDVRPRHESKEVRTDRIGQKDRHKQKAQTYAKARIRKKIWKVKRPNMASIEIFIGKGKRKKKEKVNEMAG